MPFDALKFSGTTIRISDRDYWNSCRGSIRTDDVWSRVRTLLALQERAIPGSSILGVQPGGSRPPLYLVHGAGGGMLWGYNNLARHLADQPVYAFQSRGLAGRPEFTRIEEMAAAYVADLVRFQPHGPYCLGGYCFGGTVAFEMARQLTAQQRAVSLLLLLNCWPRNSSYAQPRWTPAFWVHFLGNLLFRLKHQAATALHHPRAYWQWRTAWMKHQLKALVSRTPDGCPAVADVDPLQRRPEHERRLWRTHVQAWLQYHPKPYPGSIVLFRTRGHPLICSFDHQMGWGTFATGGVTVTLCPGDHESILDEENAPHTASQVQRVLESVHCRRLGQVGTTARAALVS